MKIPAEIWLSAYSVYLPFIGLGVIMFRGVNLGHLKAFLPYLLLAIIFQTIQFFHRSYELYNIYWVVEYITVSFLFISWGRQLRLSLFSLLIPFGLIITASQLSNLNSHNIYSLLFQSFILTTAGTGVIYLIMRYRIGSINYSKLLIVCGIVIYYSANIFSFSIYGNEFSYIAHSFVNAFTNLIILVGVLAKVWHHKLIRVSISQ